MGGLKSLIEIDMLLLIEFSSCGHLLISDKE